MSIKSFQLAGKYIKAAYIYNKQESISRDDIESLKKLEILLRRNKNYIFLFLNKLKDFKHNMPKSLFTACDLAIKHDRFLLIPDLIKYWILHYQKNFSQFLDIYSTVSLDLIDIKKCEIFITKKYGIKINSKFFIDQSLIAGIRLETPYLLWDNSIKNKINIAANFLKNWSGDLQNNEY